MEIQRYVLSLQVDYWKYHSIMHFLDFSKHQGSVKDRFSNTSIMGNKMERTTTSFLTMCASLDDMNVNSVIFVLF